MSELMFQTPVGPIATPLRIRRHSPMLGVGERPSETKTAETSHSDVKDRLKELREALAHLEVLSEFLLIRVNNESIV